MSGRVNYEEFDDYYVDETVHYVQREHRYDVATGVYHKSGAMIMRSPPATQPIGFLAEQEDVDTDNDRYYSLDTGYLDDED